MERIKLAIERAKTEAGIFTATELPPARIQAVTAPARTDTFADSGGLDRFGQNTPVVQLDPEHLERHRVIAHHKSHPASWAFDLLRTQVLQQMSEHGWRTIAITAPSMESGKTLVAINLAISIAQQKDRTALLVDFDLRRPRVASALGLNQVISLNEVLGGRAQVPQALVNPGMERLTVLPTMRPEPDAAEVLASGKVRALIDELRQRYSNRTVIFDLPPVLVADDVLAVVPHVDCVLMVVGSGDSTEKEIEASMSRLKNARLIGVVLNKDDSPSKGDYY